MIVPLAVIAALLLSAKPAHSFLPELATPSVRIKWPSLPVVWNLNPNISGANISGSRSVADVMQSSFAVWTSAPNIALSVVRGADSNVTSESSSLPGVNLICFICTDTSFSDVGTLAVTLFRFNVSTGAMTKTDILFNPNPSGVTFTTDPSSANGSIIDLQTVATHEIGHFLGLDHSAVTNAVMFPFSPDIRETLAADDVAGMSLLYPKSPPDVAAGAIAGTVQFATGGGVFGAHVFADSVTGLGGFGMGVRNGPIGTLTDANGNYAITGLPVDTYMVSAEPLDQPVTNTDVSDYAKVFGKTSVQTNFTTRQH
ncbi:MAG: matrixin family metalloprotease [Terriglobales bacterium]